MAMLMKHVNDAAYTKQREGLLKDLRGMNQQQLQQKLYHDMNSPHPEVDASHYDLTRKMVGELRSNPYVPDEVKAILDSTSGTTGQQLIRQDLEATLRFHGGASR
jgi:hypothetical protein